MSFAPHRATPAELAERLEADRGGEPYLLLRDAHGRQRIVSLAGRTRMTIGRLAGNDVVIDTDEQISRTHAVLERVGPDWTVTDDGLSRNGSFLNDTRIARRERLRSGDRLRVGSTELCFREGAFRTGGTTTAIVGEAKAPALSDAQRRVLIELCRPCVADGAFPTPAPNRVIAEELSVSIDTVRTHMRALFDRFGLPDLPQNAKRAELARRALVGGALKRHDFDG